MPTRLTTQSNSCVDAQSCVRACMYVHLWVPAGWCAAPASPSIIEGVMQNLSELCLSGATDCSSLVLLVPLNNSANSSELQQVVCSLLERGQALNNELRSAFGQNITYLLTHRSLLIPALTSENNNCTIKKIRFRVFLQLRPTCSTVSSLSPFHSAFSNWAPLPPIFVILPLLLEEKKI